YQAFMEGMTINQIHELTGIDRWFLDKLHRIFLLEHRLLLYNNLSELPNHLLLEAKRAGFSDFQIAKCLFKSRGSNLTADSLKVRATRKELNIIPIIKQIDTMAAEFPAATNYLYLTYNGDTNDISLEKDQKSVIVLGSGAYRIGSSVEFDWCAVNALQTAGKMGYRKIMINYNPE
ncbi:MAG TPA: carbamoyl phosphate synthase large subunit, partial [Bacteroidales bacterium]|nr:carbamoyl phosphate synthase large subunit [Bacteroidales bacterium]